MNQAQIETAIDLHQKAFGFLLASRDSGHAASRPFDEATIQVWQQYDSCLEWVTRHYHELPLAHRPELEQVSTFAHLLSSLFATSFSVIRSNSEWQPRIQIRALPARHFDGSRKSKTLKGKERAVADTLRRMALKTLPADDECEVTDEDVNRMLNESTLADDATLWAFAAQLVNRSQYASQGPAVYQLWLALPEKTKRHLSADLVWQARQRLLRHLQPHFLAGKAPQ